MSVLQPDGRRRFYEEWSPKQGRSAEAKTASRSFVGYVRATQASPWYPISTRPGHSPSVLLLIRIVVALVIVVLVLVVVVRVIVVVIMVLVVLLFPIVLGFARILPLEVRCGL